ncbi:hypothetical protein [Lactococcus formosensis]|uniref:Uncharacterized protein n=1 Tax=Lactococcus formosensis TaxID=1281486 RepID=A0A9Q8Y518_9LACT|nr:hypothetical protein [Lactococcus formosensis]USJ21449.1 hypothetical protein LMK00_05485 [Lactococcus formosensis]
MPDTLKLTGKTDSKLPEDLNINSNSFLGYSVDHVEAPNGKNYLSVEEAVKNHSLFSVESNNFTIYLKASPQVSLIKFKASNNPKTDISEDFLKSYDLEFSEEITGAPIKEGILKKWEVTLEKILVLVGVIVQFQI